MRLHWIITLQWPSDDGLHTKTMDGTVEPSAGATRQDIYADAYKFAAQHMGAKDAAVLSFILEPNEV